MTDASPKYASPKDASLENGGMVRMPTKLSRRSALVLGAGAALTPMLGPALAAPKAGFVYNPQPKQIAPGVWVVMGVDEPITARNGGAIANISLLDTDDGVVLVDAGPSHRYGLELAVLAKTLTGKQVTRVYITHIHSDHSLGATAFDANVLWGGQGLAEDLALRGNDITNAMYRVTGDWMRGTDVPELKHVATDGVEQIGQRKFRILSLSGHTTRDLVLYEETSGLLFAGDLVFLDRAATTPDAILPNWRQSLATLKDVPHKLLVPGHGPIEPGTRGIEQTRVWLDMVEGKIGSQFNQGLDVLEMMEAPLPDWTDKIKVARHEYKRSVMHLLPRLEETQLPALA